VLLSNEVKTCQFLALQIGAGHAQLQKIVNKLDVELIKLHLPKYHDPPIFHASVAWRLPEGEIQTPDLTAMNEEFMGIIRKETVATSALSLKIGKEVFHYP
jgi:hypothetical protein